jgi:hypothetical protein
MGHNIAGVTAATCSGDSPMAACACGQPARWRAPRGTDQADGCVTHRNMRLGAQTSSPRPGLTFVYGDARCG